MVTPRTERGARRGGWRFVVLVLALAALFAGAGLWLVDRLVRIPADLVARGGEAARDLRSLAAAFHQGTVRHLFFSYATSLEGTTYLQVATLEQTEVYELHDEASTLWGALELPAVAVRATAPVTTTYFVDLDASWDLALENHRVRVYAPPLRYNKPAIDASRIEYEVRRGSLLRDEEAVLARLKQELTGRSAIRARENIGLVRETARRQLMALVRRWLLQTFEDAEFYSVEVVFADELSPGAEVEAPKG